MEMHVREVKVFEAIFCSGALWGNSCGGNILPRKGPSEEGVVESALIQAGVIEVQADNSIFPPLLFPYQIPSTKPLWKSGPCDRGVVEEKPCRGALRGEQLWCV